MKIWITRHGQTRLNREKRMQGRTDEPLNETGILQAKKMGEKLSGQPFDAVYASPLCRAVQTAALISGRDEAQIRTDPRILETDFGHFEQKHYLLLGPRMTLYWAFPELFPAPATAETIASMTERSHAFLRELEQQDYENVLVVCHGGIIRALCGYLEDLPRGIRWRPKPKNCEVRVYESREGKHRLLETITAESV